MRTKPYTRENAVAYAHKWAFGRNPRYYNYDNIGGDCTNFASQVLYAGAGNMNFTYTFGWYYRSANDRSPAWTGVEYLHSFLINNKGAGPVAIPSDISQVMPGDIVQLSFDGYSFGHSPVIVSVGDSPSPSNILVAAHTLDTDNFPLNAYLYVRVRFLHVTHVNVW
ncbi:amidase domain-containing protein [Aminipila sp.]|uniref:amidase domain-containing protein n=1 Tax=Aminipila sp. TaxID=2060095 RepID=UPI002F412E0A